MNDFSQLGFENSHYEHVLIIREKAEIRTVAKYVGIAYLLCIMIPEIISYFILDVADSYSSLSFITKIFTHPILSMIYQAVISITIFTLPFLILPWRLSVSPGELLNFKRPKKDLLLPLIFIGLGLFAFANIAANTISQILLSFGLGIYSPSFSQSKNGAEFIITFFAVAIVPAFVEEFAFRGIVLGALKRFGDGFAILVSALLFGLIHRNFAQIPFAFIIGLVLAFAVIKTGSLWTGIIIHFLNNALSLLLSTLFEVIGSETIAILINTAYFIICFLLFFLGMSILSKEKKEFWGLNRMEHKMTAKQRVLCFFSQPVVILDFFLSLLTAALLVVVV